MKVTKLVEALNATVLTKTSTEREIKTGFTGDLLSVVMGKSPEAAAWITIQSHINVVAVASLTEAACIIVTEGYKVDEDAISKANEEDVIILSTKISSYGAAVKLHELGIKA